MINTLEYGHCRWVMGDYQCLESCSAIAEHPRSDQSLGPLVLSNFWPLFADVIGLVNVSDNPEGLWEYYAYQ